MLNFNKRQMEVAVFANGCFWCTEAVFQRVEGVHDVKSGYTGGFVKNPPYREVCQGRTGHAEADKITFDPKVISFEKLLELFFATHDPTTLNKQGNDLGTQYRSGVFYTSLSQKIKTEDYILALTNRMVFKQPIVTEVTAFDVFYDAETEHDNYYNDHLNQMYCQLVIQPKVEKIESIYQDLLKK